MTSTEKNIITALRDNIIKQGVNVLITKHFNTMIRISINFNIEIVTYYAINDFKGIRDYLMGVDNVLETITFNERVYK